MSASTAASSATVSLASSTASVALSTSSVAASTSPATSLGPSVTVLTSAIVVTEATATVTTSATAAVATPLYPQPPLPDIWVDNDTSNLLPDPSWDINAAPVSLTYVAGAPDGFPRRMTVVNGQFPGPLIEANVGDRIIVDVTNNIDEGQAIHWHGFLQNGTQYMDGVPGVTQCLIPPGGTFTYDFIVDAQQYGTYWWHSHEGNTLADGIIGAIVIHSPEEPAYQTVQYDEERILLLQDWMHDQSDVIVKALVSPDGYYGTATTSEGDATLINGFGGGNCSQVHVPANCTDDLHSDIQVPVNKTIRFRIINAGSHHTFRFSIDNHPFDVVEADGTTITGASQIHELPIAPAQRYSIIVTTNQGEDGDAFWMRSRTAAECIAGGFVEDALAYFRYVTPGIEPSTTVPETTPWSDLLDPLTSVGGIGDPPVDTIAAATFSSAFGRFLNTSGLPFMGFGMNNISWKNTINQPLLLDIEQGRQLNPSYVASATFNGIGGADIIINNLGAPAHAFHLHSRKFWIVARGPGNITSDDVPNMQLNLTSPLARDTLQIDANSYAVLRIVTDTPGVWGLHCHIGFHLSQGKFAAIVVQPAAIQQIHNPTAWVNVSQGS
ncbi:hypothetical protein Q5752_003052 [Cryptotrichosporon argae]